MQNPSIKNYIAVLIATLIGLGLGFAGGQGGSQILGIPTFLIIVIVAYLIQWLAFVVAYGLKTEKFYDLTGSITYISLTTILLLSIPQIDDRAVLLLVLVVVWAARLGTFLFTRVLKEGQDSRFDEIRANFPRFLLTWTLQGLWITFTAAAAWAAITSSVRKELNWFTLLGFVIWALGFFFELVSDAQKSRFTSNPANKGKFIHEGLWSFSRHPNYFGEIIVWLGVALIALPVLKGWALLTLISPIWVIIQLVFISGIPMLEKKADERWGGQEDYEKYKKTTPVLIPRFHKK